MASRILALIIWAAVAASLAYWGLRWLAQPTGVPPNATPVSLDDGIHGDLHRLLAGPATAASGADQPDTSAASALASRMKLLGVVAPREAGGAGGVALVSIDGKPPRAIRVGGVIEGDLLLQSLTQRGAAIGQANAPASVTLDLPLLPGPATGALPPPEGVSMSDNTPPPPQGGMPMATGSLASPEGADVPDMQAPPARRQRNPG